MKRLSLISLWALLTLGCYSHNALLRPSASFTAKIDAAYRAKVGVEAVADLATPPPAVAEPACEIFLRLSYSRAGAGRARPHYEIVSADTCIKRAGGSLEFPGSITLVYDPRNGALGWDAWREMGYCDDDGRDVWIPNGGDAPSEDVVVPTLSARADADQRQDDSDLEVCTWNRNFRDSYPLDLELWTADGSPLRTQIELLQVFRNGELAFKWTGSESSTAHLYIAGARLTAQGMPHLSDFDLRVFAAGAKLDEAVLKQEVRERADAFSRRFSLAGKALYEAELWGDESLRSKLAPLRQAVDRVRQELATLTGEPVPTASGGVTILPAGSGSLLERYRALKGKAADEVKAGAAEIVKDVSEKLDQSPKELRDALEQARRDVMAEHEQRCGAGAPGAATDALCRAYATFEDFERALETLDRTVETTLSAVEETRSLASSLRQDALELGKSTELQAKLYDQTVASLVKEGDFFDPYVANPAAIGEEAILPMRYSDSTQVYVLAPWTGVAFRPSDDFETEPSPTYAIPILDVAGLRYQWARNRLADLRLGAGIMYFEDADSVAVEGESDASNNEPRFALQVNAALGVFRAGAAFVPAAETEGEKNSKWRVLLGVDLYKLLTGTDLQVAATNM